MIRVAALTSGPNVPSTRFRIRQHVGPLRALGVSVREHCPRLSKHSPTPGAYRFGTHRPGTGIYEAWLGLKLLDRATGVLGSWRADVTWLTRNLIPGHRTLERLLRRPLVLDVDDAVWLQRPHGAEASRALARRAALVIAGNAFLADYYAGCGAETLVVPTAIDTARFRPPPQRGERERFGRRRRGGDEAARALAGREDGGSTTPLGTGRGHGLLAARGAPAADMGLG